MARCGRRWSQGAPCPRYACKLIPAQGRECHGGTHFVFDPAIRKIIYTTNAIESLNRVIRKSIKTRGSFPTEEAATKLIYLAIRNFEKGGRNVSEWFAARNQFAIMFEERFNA
ncbi:MAG: transposase-like protein [Maritalea sp.]|jgi:transposase-like protein